MHPSNSVYAQKLYSVTIENVTVGLLLDHKTKEDTCSVLPGIPFDSMSFNTMHQHAYVELFVCLQGQLTVGTEQGELVLSAGDAAFIPIGLMHCKKQDGNGAQYRVIGMTFTRRYPKNSFNLYRVMMKFCCEDNILLLRGRQSFCESVAALFDAADGDPYLPAMRLAMLLAETARELRSPSPAEMLGGMFHSKELDRISMLDYVIDSYFMHPLTAAYAADQLCMSERQFSRLVRKRYGSTFHEVLTDKRLTVAAKMLTESSQSVSAIAQQVGYQSVSSFHRAFCNRFGATPAQYRAKMPK